MWTYKEDTLHYSTDIWSSAVVFVGLIGLTIARFIPGLDWMYKADTITALVVALIVIYISGELGWQTISALLDNAPTGLADKVGKVAAPVNGVVDAHAVPIRPSGAYMFIDVHVTMDGNCNLNDAHASTKVNEKAIHGIHSPEDIIVPVKLENILEPPTKKPIWKIKKWSKRQGIKSIPGRLLYSFY